MKRLTHSRPVRSIRAERWVKPNFYQGKMMNHIPKKRAVSDAEKIKSLKDTTEANLPAMVELFLQDAKLQRAKFEAYLGEGFTPEQAMQLCTRP